MQRTAHSIMLHIHQFPCLNDNYGYLAHDDISGDTAAIDTPDASKYLDEAAEKGWTITHIWNTHWHPDHAGGNLAIKEKTGCKIVGPAGEAAKIPGIDQQVGQGDAVQLGAMTAHVIDVPGHTLGHIAFHKPSEAVAFVGDAVFALGCGRVFEGDAAMMWSSLSRLRDLPPETLLHCAHEYTQANARFAETIETGNAALMDYVAEIDAKRARGERTVPMPLAREIETNPFLRADVDAVQAAMGTAGDPVATFAAVRALKDKF